LNLQEVRVNLIPLASAREVVQAILCLNRDKQKLVISLLWAWWMGRNKANAGERVPSVEDIASKAMIFSSEIFQQKKNDEGGTNSRNRNHTGWRPPPPDVLKINSDGAFREKDKTGAWGFVVRDSDGQGMLAGSGRLRAVHDALSAEGEACLMALKAAMEVGISHVIIETDSLILIKAIQSNSFDRAPAGAIIKEIRELLALHFVPLKFTHVPRSCNRSAHELAHSGWSRDPDLPAIWYDPLPNSVLSLLDRVQADPEFGE